MKKVIFLIFLSLVIYSSAQQSDRVFRRYNILNKNQVKTVYTNGGVMGHPVGAGPRGAWLYDNNGYLGDVSPFVGCEIPIKVYNDDPAVQDSMYFHSVTYCLADRRPNAQELSPTGRFWGFEPIGGYYNDDVTSGAAVALFTDKSTWPESWPDRLDDMNDPGWQGQWNGYFGKNVTNATEETYFRMDDNHDKEFNKAGSNIWGVAFKPDSTNTDRDGMALEVGVRALQWNQFLAQDCIFWLYEITNEGTTNYNKATFGMLVGTYVGVTSTEDFHEYDDDWSFFDAERNITYTGDFPDRNTRNPLWTGPVGMVGYAFLESPSNQFDGIDNDNDDGENNTVAAAKYFTPEDFDSTLIKLNDAVVLIDDDFNRKVVIVTQDTTVISMGQEFHIIPGVTKLIEGNVFEGSGRIETINPNAIDGLDNDLDGLIDENYFLHYRQRRQDPETGYILIDKLRPLRYVDYFTGEGLDDMMLDEARDDGIDNNNDWNAEFDDVGLDGLAGTNDYGENDGIPTSGYQNGIDTGLPGEPHIDKTDVLESDQIGLTSFVYFTNADAPTTLLTDDEQWWDLIAPGTFHVPSSIQNNVPVQGEDGDFFYSSGYFPLRPKQTERFSIALVYGGGRGGYQQDLDDLLKNLKTVQKIFDSNYQFPKPPDTPTLHAEAGDGKVVLTWDRKAEESFDPVLREYDFEGYRLYKSTDPGFKDVFTVTDAFGKVRGYKPLGRWDLANDIIDIFYGSSELTTATSGFAWDLGEDTGLRHYYFDEDVENGRTYYYALTAYDRGDSEQDIFPAESPFSVTVFSSGEIRTDQNTVRVIPSQNVAGYTEVEPQGNAEHISGPATGWVDYDMVDEKSSLGHTYLLQFEDNTSSGAGLDHFWPTKTHNYSIKDLTEFTDEAFIIDTVSYVDLSHPNIDSVTVKVEDEGGNQLNNKAYQIDYKKGRIRPNANDPDGEMEVQKTYNVTYEYFPVYKSENIGEVQDDENKGTLFDTDLFDGTQLSIKNFNSINLIDTASGWNRPDGYAFNFSVVNIPSLNLYGRRTPHNFKAEFFNTAVDTSLDSLGAPGLPINFRITNTTLNKKVECIFYPFKFIPNDSGWYEMKPRDQIYLFEYGPDGELHYTWYLYPIPFEDGREIELRFGDYLDLQVTKPFRKTDEFIFTTPIPAIDQQKATLQMSNIRVVPNPYIVSHAHEAPLPPGITSGRGERKVTFTHIPENSKITIFTSAGNHVATLRKDPNDVFKGSMSWNLKNKDNLDIAYGVYFYVVESPVGTKKGKMAIIK